MKKTSLIFLAALSLAGAASLASAPAMAQYGPPPQARGWEIDQRIQWIQDRILHGRNDGSLDRREFDRVQGELNGIRHEEHRIRDFNGGHLDPRGRADLEGRLDRLNDQIHWIRVHNETRPW